MFSKSKYEDTVFAKEGLLPLLDDNESLLLSNMMKRVDKIAQASADKRCAVHLPFVALSHVEFADVDAGCAS